MSGATSKQVDDQVYIKQQYADVLRLLADCGFRPDMTMTGGGCYAITFTPIPGREVCITDSHGPLAEVRTEQVGWGVGVYNEDQESVFYEDTADSSPLALFALITKARGTGTYGMVDISGLAKADVLAALYNASSPLGLGFDVANAPDKMTSDQAKRLLAADTYFEYLYGRPLKVYLGLQDVFDPDGYDDDGATGMAQWVIGRLRQAKTAKGEPVIEHIFVNEYDEFTCICKRSNFCPVVNQGGKWHEIEPVTQWDGWACCNCARIVDDKGKVIAHPKDINFLDVDDEMPAKAAG